MSDVEATMAERAAEPPAEVVSEPDDLIAAAARTVELLRAKRASLLDRIEVGRRTSSELAFDAFVSGGLPRKSLDDLNAEAFALDRDLVNLDSAIAEGERRHHAALAKQAALAERDRAQLARERFAEFARVAQAYSDQIDGLVQLFGELQAAAVAMHQTNFGPGERQVLRWAQRTLVFRCQHDRNLRFEDAMADGRERMWLQTAPHDWLTKLQGDTAAVLGPAAAKASEAAE
jgi:hypothetical protein